MGTLANCQGRITRNAAIVLCGLLLCCVALAATAEDDDAGRLARKIAPYVDGQTVAIMHVDLGGIDSAESITLLAKLFGLNERGHARLQGEVAPLGLLPQRGSADVFVVMSLSDVKVQELQAAAKGGAPIAGLPMFIVISTADDAPARAIAVELKRGLPGNMDTETIGEAIVIGSAKTRERLKSKPAVERPEIAAALAALDGGSAHGLLIPPPEARQLVELVWPRLPDWLGGGPTRNWTQRVQWAAVGIDLPPAEPELRIVLQSPSDEAAKALEGELAAVAAKLSERSDVRDAAPKFNELWARLAPRAEGNRVTATLNEQGATLSEYSTMLAALLRVAQTGSDRPMP